MSLIKPTRRKLLIGAASLIAAPAILRAQVPMTGAGKGAPGGGGADPFNIDGTPQGANNGGAATLALPGISTTYGNCIVYVGGITNGGPVTSITSSPSSLSFSRRTQQAGGTSAEVWSAKASSPLTNEVITVNTTSSAFLTFAAAAFSGSHFASPYDSNGAIPAASASAVTFTTTNANDILVAFGEPSSTTAGTGWTLIYGGNFMLAEYKIVSSTQSALAMTDGVGGAIGPSVGDAIIQGP